MIKRTRELQLSAATLAAILVTFAPAASSAQGVRDHISIVGSSTVFPFAARVAERFGQMSDGKTPTVESTGTGGGFKVFCGGLGFSSPDIVNASRRIKPSEFEDCRANGVTDILEVPIGFDGIALASGRDGPDLDLTTRDLFLALAKSVPSETGELIPNPNQTWSDVNPLLPEVPINVSGPSPVHGTREAFEDLAMETGCRSLEAMVALQASDKDAFDAACRTVREDGRFINVGGSYNLIVDKLRSDPTAIGVLGFNYLDQNLNSLKPIRIDGVEPTFEAIADGDYPIARSIYFYVKLQHVDNVPGLFDYVETFISDGASGEDGYLEDRGLIPLDDALRAAVNQRVDAKEKITIDDLI